MPPLVFGTAAACGAYGENSARARQRDHSRFVSWASNAATRDACLEHASLLAFNAYPGWYDHRRDATEPAKLWPKLAETVRRGATASGAHTVGKPFLISETGAGGRLVFGLVLMDLD